MIIPDSVPVHFPVAGCVDLVTCIARPARSPKEQGLRLRKKQGTQLIAEAKKRQGKTQLSAETMRKIEEICGIYEPLPAQTAQPPGA